MRTDNLRESENIQDLRNAKASVGGRGSANLRLLIPMAKFLLGNKIGRVILTIGVVAYFMGYNPLSLLNLQTSSPMQKQQTKKVSAHDDEMAKFVSVVLAQTEDVWHKIFQDNAMKYREPKLVLFRGSVNSGCGYASSQTGPFYCPADEKVYLDLGFFDELSQKYNASGDFAQAYVIAHEVGHHVQHLIGTLDKAHKIKRSLSKKEANAVQVKIELQADCYAGVWAYYLSDILENGDIDEALNAASAIGDDTLQKKAQGYVVPDAFTHGSSKSRVAWFKKGYINGNLSACDNGI